MKNCIQISGERVFLEGLDDGHLSRNYVEWMQDEEVLQFLTGRTEKYSAEELQEYVAKMNGSSTDHLFGIFLKEGNVHIGNVKIGSIDFERKFADIGLLIGNKNMWEKGYGTEVIGLVTQYAFDELKLNKLTAGMAIENVGSYKAFIKAGYRECGRLAKHVLLKGEYVDVFLVEKCSDFRQ